YDGCCEIAHVMSRSGLTGSAVNRTSSWMKAFRSKLTCTFGPTAMIGCWARSAADPSEIDTSAAAKTWMRMSREVEVSHHDCASQLRGELRAWQARMANRAAAARIPSQRLPVIGKL